MNKIFFFLSAMAAPFLLSCSGNGHGHGIEGGDTIPMRYADNISMVEYPQYTEVTMRNPWDTTKNLHTLYLVPRDSAVPEPLKGKMVVKVPVRSSVVYASMHASLIRELGAADAIKGMCDAAYVRNHLNREALANGTIVDCGQCMAPNVEKIMLLNPELILVSAFEDSNDHNKVAQMGIPIIDCADYMETSPLGRAEWMKFFGRLYGKGEEADSAFAVAEKDYLSIKEKLAGVTNRPLVLTDLIYGGTWGAPGANSTVGILIRDAGGKSPFETYKCTGSVQLAPEEVLFKGGECDLWLIKYAQEQDLTLAQLGADNNMYTKFVPYKEGNVYGCNTQYSAFYEETPFHPHWLLAEYASIFHPEIELSEQNHHYFSKLSDL